MLGNNNDILRKVAKSREDTERLTDLFISNENHNNITIDGINYTTDRFATPVLNSDESKDKKKK
ncbi:MAG: hypothetical protein KAI79_16525 [Bacteroidales bacterium]|nr:hypothetical protein [Bacteroidales bacterium]